MSTRLLLLVAGLAIGAASLVAARFAFFFLPLRWTGELDRLREALEVRRGSFVADVGAGDGTFALNMAESVGPTGRVYATELSAARRNELSRRVAAAGIGHVEIITATVSETNLTHACCDGIYLRAVLHHVPDHRLLARQLYDAARPGGRLAVIDFQPGALWFHGAGHGVTVQATVEAFTAGGWHVLAQEPEWGGGMFMVLFQRR